MQTMKFLLLIFALLVEVPGFHLQFRHVAFRTALQERSVLNMAATGGQTSGESKTGTGTLIKQVTKEKTTFKEEIEKNWRLLLHDDDIHTIEEVCDKVAGICPLCPGPRAYEVTMQVHLTGAGTICSANKKIVQEYEKKLQKAGLSVSSAPEDEFEDEDEYGEEGEEVGEDEEE